MNRIYRSTLQALLTSVLVAMSSGAAADAPKVAAEEMRTQELEDLEVVRRDYLPKEMAFSPATRALAVAQLEHLERVAGSMSPIEFAVGLAELGALTDNAHSGLRRRDPRVQPTARLPLRLIWLADGLVVARAGGDAQELAGARVLKIEGRAPAALYTGAKVLLGGSEAGRKLWLNDWIETVGTLHALGLAHSPRSVALTLKLRSGQVVTRSIAMQPVLAQAAMTAETDRIWSPQPLSGEHDWKPALAPAHAPLYLQDAERPFRVVTLAAEHALYIQFRTNEDEGDESISAFIEHVHKQIDATHPQHLILDLRFEFGGNLLTTLAFMRKLSAGVPGQSYLLIGSSTFSAGIISAAAFKQGGGARVTIVGEEVGDRMHFWSEGAKIELPNSHYSFRYTDGQFNLSEGCAGEPACMDDRYHIDVNFVSLVPDVAAPLTVDAYLAGRDPAMDLIKANIARQRD